MSPGVRRAASSEREREEGEASNERAERDGRDSVDGKLRNPNSTIYMEL